MKSASLASRLILPVVGATLLLYLAVFGWILRSARKEAQVDAEQRARDVGEQSAAKVTAFIDRAFETTRTLAAAFEGARAAGGRLDRDTASAMIRAALEREPEILALYTLWEPDAFDGLDAEHVGRPGHDSSGRFIPYWNRGAGSISLEPLVNYDTPGPGDYYILPRRGGHDCWIEPYLYPVAGREVLMTSLVSPVEVDGRFAGIVGLDFDLSTLTDLVREIRPYEGAGHAILVSADGRVVSHPDPQAVGRPLVDEDGSIRRLIRADGERAVAAGVGRADFLDGPAYLVTVPVIARGIERPWQLVVGIPESRVFGDASVQTIRVMAAGAGLVALLSAVLWWTARRIAAELLDVSRRLHDGSRETVTAVEQLAREGTSLSDGAQEQAAAIEETGTSLRELSSRTENNRSKAESSSRLAAEAHAEAEAGAADMARMQESLVASRAAAEQVSGIIKTIDEIAFQTNLLALNAAVEAARAGEHGAGFAVVADEVRSLARRCSDATRQSDELIERSRTASREAEAVGTAVGDRFARIRDRNRSLDALLGDLLSGTIHQADGVRAIATAVAQVSDVTHANATSAVQTAAASTQLSAQAQSANDLAARLVTLVAGIRSAAAAEG